MKLPLTQEGCKFFAFYSISISIIITVVLALLSIWDVTTTEVGSRLMYSLYAILGGILIFTVTNLFFILSDQSGSSDGTLPKSGLSDSLRKAKQRNTHES
jgi:hypothetical protein